MTDAVKQAGQLMSAGKAEEAERVLRRRLGATPGDSNARTMLAQLLASHGKKSDAIAELLVAVDRNPGARPARILLARLANDLGQAPLAERHARSLTESNTGDSEAWSALGYALFTQGRSRAAVAATRNAVDLSPSYAAARYNLASMLCHLERSEDALIEADHAGRLGSSARNVDVIRARALIQLDRFDEAEQLLVGLLRSNRYDTQTHAILIQLRQVRGDDEPLRDLRDAALRADAPSSLRLAFANALRRSGDHEAAVDLLQRLIVARAAFAEFPGDAGTAENFVATAIASGHAVEALPVVEAFRASRPRDQRWITYRVDIARLRGEHGYDQWFDPRVVVRTYDLPAPSGFRDMREFLGALESTLGAQHRQKNHPLDQSLRHGTQTSRNLLVRPPPEVAQLIGQFESALADYQHALESNLGPVPDGAEPHPLMARNRSPARLIGCWSVRLRRGGFHVNHIHPEGWLSSAFYVSVPAEVHDSAKHEGWLKFGEPRFPVPGLNSVGVIEPIPGRLVLFPSYLWHGTNAISGEEVRLSLAFDALPQTEIQ